MKVVLLAGGHGTRISEESVLKPKPMIEIGGKPILWHIMKMYSAHGFNDFIVCCGYKGYVIKEYFANYFLHTSDVTIDMQKNSVEVHFARSEPWRVTLVDTGESTMTGGRVLRIRKYLNKNEDFCLTYGDGVCDINIKELVKFHTDSKRDGTVTVVQPPGRFGVLEIEGDSVRRFSEKPAGDGGSINGGFFVLNERVLNSVKDDHTVWEREPMESLANSNQLGAFRHDGFWHPMDTLRDKIYLEDLWKSGEAPWKKWW